MSGMGLAGFLTNKPRSGSRGKFFSWKDSKEKNAIVWLHTRFDPIFNYQHAFMMEDEYEEKDSGKKIQVLRYPRFVSPEDNLVLEEQYFRDKSTDRMKRPPRIDPFLITREFLRTMVRNGKLTNETPIFEFYDPKKEQIIRWHAGELSGLVKRNQARAFHSLDAKLQYTFVVVDDRNPGNGPQIAQESSSLGDAMRATVEREIMSKGDEKGDPTRHPYAFMWTYTDKPKKVGDNYAAFRYDRAECTDEVWKQITEIDPPEVTTLTTPQDGDMEKIRVAFEKAMRIDLPLDLIFSTEESDRKAAMDGLAAMPSGSSPKPPASRPSTTTVPTGTGAARPTGAVRPGTAPAAATPTPNPTPAQGAAPAATGTGPQTRRKKVEPAAPPPPPAVEMIPCDDCQAPMPATASKCENCGAEYQVDASEEPVAPVRPTGGTGPVRPTPSTAAASAQPEERCWSCGGTQINPDRSCATCGMSQEETADGAGDDDIPF